MIAIVEWALYFVEKGYNPPARPACAYYVSEVLSRAGWKGEKTGWVPTLYDAGRVLGKSEDPSPGDLVIFQQTYDAEPPAGIGPEDDMTHVGILLYNPAGTWKFAHYSASADKPVIDSLTGYWQDKFQCFVRVSTGSEPAIPDTTIPVGLAKMKIFANPKASRPKIVFDGKEHGIKEMIATIRTEDNHEILITSHPFEAYPCLSIDRKCFPIEYIGEKGFEYREKE